MGLVQSNPANYEHMAQNSPPPEFTTQQVRNLIARGLRPDLALMPYQMPRIDDQLFQIPPPKSRPTQTVKNLVNLRKNTLSLTRSPTGRMCLSFTVDALVAARISIFYLASEFEGPDGQLRFEEKAPHAHPSDVYRLSAGSSQQFSQPEDSALRWTDLSLYHQQLFLSAYDKTYPVVIHIEAQDEKKQHETKQANSVAHSQTTFATVTKREDSFEIKVIRQKIKMDNVSYELQEIYGLEPKADSATYSTQECVICMSSPRNTVVLPCRHLCLCLECSHALQEQTNRCPICRTAVESLVQLPSSSLNV